MRFLKIEKPRLDTAAAAALLRRGWDLEGRLQPLPGERDLNFRVSTGTAGDWVLKIANADEPAAVLDCQLQALEHIAAVDPTLPTPRLRRALDNAPQVACVDAEGRPHLAYLIGYLPGEVPGERPLAASELERIGRAVARLGQALRGFFHPALGGRGLLWDNAEAPRLLPHVELLPVDQRAMARELLSEFAERHLPAVRRLRAQAIHGDVHPFNLLLDDAGEVSGLIDFGDLLHGALIQDLANPLADFLLPAQPPAKTLGALLKGYQAVTPLETEEVDLLLPLVEVRLLQGPLVAAIRAAMGTPLANELEGGFGARCLPLLRRLRGAEGQQLAALARRLAGCPPLAEPEVGRLLQRRRQVLGEKLSLFYDPPLHLVRGDGVWLWDERGRAYLDCYNNVPHVGHCHPTVTAAIARQARLLNTNTRYVTDQAVLYAERLAATCLPELSAVVYVNSGSEANDLAWRMAKAWTGARGGLAMDFAYHGITEAIDAFSPSNDPTAAPAPHLRFLPPPDDYRGPFKRGEPDLARRYADLADEKIADLQVAGYGVAAAMVDSAFMTNGMLEAPPGYLQAVAAKVRAAGGLVIADEVQSGFGRMGGAFWGHRHHGLVPDFVTIGKPAGNGHPIGAVITRPEILRHFTATAPFFSTFGGNNVSCAAGLAVLDVIESEGLVENARLAGARLKAGLQSLMERHTLIGDVRGTGLALGVELVRDRRSLTPADVECRRLQSLLRDEGVLVGGEGVFANILKVRPPLAFRPEQAEIVVTALDRALRRL